MSQSENRTLAGFLDEIERRFNRWREETTIDVADATFPQLRKDRQQLLQIYENPPRWIGKNESARVEALLSKISDPLAGTEKLQEGLSELMRVVLPLIDDGHWLANKVRGVQGNDVPRELQVLANNSDILQQELNVLVRPYPCWQCDLLQAWTATTLQVRTTLATYILTNVWDELDDPTYPYRECITRLKERHKQAQNCLAKLDQEFGYVDKSDSDGNGRTPVAQSETREWKPNGQEQAGNIPPETAIYVFKRCGETGYIVAFGKRETKTIPRVAGKLPGLDYIHVLLRREEEHHRTPNRVPNQVSSAEVIQAAACVHQGHSESGNREAQMDRRAWKEAQKCRDELNGIVEDLSADPADKLEAREELSRLDASLAASTHPGTKGKPQMKLFSDDRTRQSWSIRKAIGRAITQINHVDSELAYHFKKHINHTGGGHGYAPDLHIDWDLK